MKLEFFIHFKKLYHEKNGPNDKYAYDAYLLCARAE